MKKLIFLLSCLSVIVLVSCKNRNKEINMNDFNKQWQAHVDSVASTFTEEDPYNAIKIDTLQLDSIRKLNSKFKENELLIGFKSSMTKKQYEKHFDELKLNKTLKLFNRDGDYAYRLKVEDNKSVDIQITPFFAGNKLFKLSLLCWGETGSAKWDMANYYYKMLGKPFEYRYNYYWFNNNIEIKIKEDFIKTDPNLSPILMGIVTITDITYKNN